ncbi:putative hydro-lyase [Acuticoccus sp. M5D2P5]|uniref:putative hydro-lyase n=1 Tax=Acuticoccus kalidii TaxID=2910977 RepID=UPI001F231BDE|nr:putative hydro-lyase [Acuticoccus kalidii]MCF3936122.1 putative hydro-lyase [Acuticoccus kalidii]
MDAMPMDPAARLEGLTAAEVRAAIRRGDYRWHTAGLAPGKLQANLAIFPERYALDFLRFCQRNSKPCPVVGITDTGDPVFRTLGADVDVRTDLPRYRVFRNGVLEGEVDDLKALWRSDLVAVALGCSFTFEHALLEAGIPMHHIESGTAVPVFDTTIDCLPAGPFYGTMVVSMRPIPEDRVTETIEICSRYPLAHGAPIHVGDPAAIGIGDIARPDYGDQVLPRAGEVPVFWACGVTPQSVILNAGLELAITHAPGHMLVTDVDDTAEVPIATTA